MSDNIVPLDDDVCNVTFDKKEYAIVGDAVFAQSVVGVPGWMQELIGDLVTEANGSTYDAMSGYNLNLYNAMLSLQVAENQYTQIINSKITDQEAFIQAVETLNSTVQGTTAEIVGIKQTYATKDFAMATAAQTLEASLNNGAIKSSLGQLASTMTNQYGTMAQRMDVLESTFEDLNSDVEGYANATSGLETFVGKNAPGTNAPVIATSKFYQDLNVYLEGTNYTTGGTNTLVNQVTAAATGVESKFAYNSTLRLNGATYSSGFGLATSVTPGSDIPVGSSEFWVSADKFKLTTTGYNGTKYSPFTVNGTTGEITFNGKVNFTNVTNTPTIPTNISQLSNDAGYTTVNTVKSLGYVLPSEVANAINNNTTTINGSKITTGTIQAGAIAAGAITADKISADVFSGQTIIGGNIYGTRIEGANILGAVIKSSWIDYSNTGVLTNWQYFTPATVPSRYVNNFAKNTNGSLVVDSMGYVRLPGSSVIRTPAHSQTNEYQHEYAQLTPFTIPLVAYDYYQIDTANRFVYTGGTISGSATIRASISRPGLGAGAPWTIRIRFYIGADYYECYGSGSNYYDYISRSVRKNNAVVWSSGYFKTENPTVINQSSYGMPVAISVYNDTAHQITVTIGSSLNFNGYIGQANLINLLECKATNGYTYNSVSVNVNVFTVQQ